MKNFRFNAIIGLLVLGLTISFWSPSVRAEAPETRLVWARGASGTIEVFGTKGGARHDEARTDIQALADRLDALRTIRPHVRWMKLTWREGRIEGEIWADDPVHANTALLAVRDLFPGRPTAGSGIRQSRTSHDRPWAVRLIMGEAPEHGPALTPID